MRWALTALVLSSVSFVVVTLTIEQGARAVGHPGDLAASRARLLILRRVLLAVGAAAVATGHWLGHAGRTAGHEIQALLASTAAAIRLRAERVTERRARRRSRAALPTFEQCAQSTAPETTSTATFQQSTSWLAPASYRDGWISRVFAVMELVAVIAVTGSAVAVVLLAVGWKATHLH